MKFIKRLIFVFVLAIVLVFGALFLFLNSIQVHLTNDVLPEDVYSEQGELLPIAKLKLLGLVGLTVTDSDYTLVEEFINYMILDLIHKELNENYDPFSEVPTKDTSYIYDNDYVYINYLYASLTEDNQILLTISFGTSKVFSFATTLELYFDVDINIVNFSLTLTLTNVFLEKHEISFNRLDQIFSYLDSASIEDSVTTGTLDLETYTYSVSMMNP